MSKQNKRMRKRLEEGRTAFIVKEGLYHFGVKLWVLYLIVTYMISYRFDPSLFVVRGELIRSGIYLLAFLAIGSYWGFFWFQMHTADKKRENDKSKSE
ncbi:hypothetical protein ACM26V_23245 [Salipaludibacillus sp. HK11]|uniref:hypothetical protein n=1 Tax=Salipaludibacillus sp. HK11 TaxID=3394320 RepID=UPI0039FBF823